MDPQQARTAETFDQYKDNYSDAVDKAVAFTGLKTDFFTRVKADYLLDAAAAMPGGAATLDVLDVGCGVGNYHPLLAPQFRSLTGVDVSGACIDTARRRNADVRYEVYGGEKLPFDDASFDAAFTICVMHHVPPANWGGFAREMMRVLKPGGTALVFEHNPRNPLTMRAVNNCPFDADAVLMRSETTEQLFKDAGFKDIRTRYILNIPPFNRLMRKADVLFTPLHLGAQYFVTSRK
ncbi:MAG: class I SAM-dependent methyltransferase [Rhizobiaceae bacterium]|jgi:SAM-dependent methyltransferase|nr:class I SAM-dependent methyltransferase [Rhizobiaceae bacterium]